MLATVEDGDLIRDLLLERLQGLTPARCAAIVELDAERDELKCLAVRRADIEESSVPTDGFARAGTVVGDALARGRPLQLRPDTRPDGADALIHALLGGSLRTGGAVIPLLGGTEVELGALLVLDPSTPLTPQDLRCLLALGAVAAVTIERGRLRGSGSAEAVRLELMSVVLQVTSSGLEEDALLRKTVHAIRTLLPADYVEIMVRDGAELRLRYASGRGGAPAGSGSPHTALHQGAVTRREPARMRWQEGDTTSRPGELNAVCVPLLSQGRVIGSLLVLRRGRDYDDQEVELLSTVAAHLGLVFDLSGHSRRSAVEAHRLERLAAERSTALKETREQLERSQWLVSLGEIAAGVAHDLNNALNPIVAFAELIREHRTQPEKVQEYAERILMAAQGGAETVRRIQRFTRHRLGAAPVQPVVLSVLVNEAVELARPLIAGPGREIEVQESVDQDLVVLGNASELRQALMNLITNALDAMPAGGTLRFVGRRDGDRAVLAVQDTGIGMGAGTRHRALEPFYTTKGAHGTGLGLAEVFGIVRRHGGELELESWRDVGTTVLLRLPAAYAMTGESARPSELRPTERKSRYRILLVDDNVLSLEAMAASLRAAGHSAVIAATAQTALGLFRPGRFDVILSDLGLPDMTGWELVDRVRQIDPNIRSGITTGWEVLEDTEELRRRGIEFVLTKPVDSERLLALL